METRSWAATRSGISTQEQTQIPSDPRDPLDLDWLPVPGPLCGRGRVVCLLCSDPRLACQFQTAIFASPASRCDGFDVCFAGKKATCLRVGVPPFIVWSR